MEEKVLNFSIKKATYKHSNDIAHLEEICFSHPRSQKTIEEEIENESIIMIVVTNDNDNVLGYGSMNIVLDEAYINDIAVFPEFRHMGVGRIIVKSFVDYCYGNNFSFLSLEVRESNFPAINLYASEGFELIGQRKNFYSDPKENANIMTKYFKR